MMLVAVPASQSTCNVAMVIQFYGSSTYAVRGHKRATPPVPMPEFLVIDYNSHRIEQLHALEFIQKYPPQYLVQ